jgi:hypothetical protein
LADGRILQRLQVFRRVFSRGPGIRKSSGVVVADKGILIARRGAPPPAARSAIWEMPSQEKRIIAAEWEGDGPELPSSEDTRKGDFRNWPSLLAR